VSTPELPVQPKLDASAEVVEMGAALYGGYCKICHGSKVVARFEGSVPDLRYSTVGTLEAWDAIVIGGSKAINGMPGMEVSVEQSQAIRSYVLSRAEALRTGGPGGRVDR